MIVDIIKLYEVFISASIFIGAVFLLYSDRFLVVHRQFLVLIALGSGLSILVQAILFFYWPDGLQIAHLIFILLISVGLYSLISTNNNNYLSPSRYHK